MHRPRHMRNWSVGQIDTLDEIKMARPRSNSEQLKVKFFKMLHNQNGKYGKKKLHLLTLIMSPQK